jgi:hypothetical protein
MSINIKILDVPGMNSKTLREKKICFCISESQKLSYMTVDLLK